MAVLTKTLMAHCSLTSSVVSAVGILTTHMRHLNSKNEDFQLMNSFSCCASELINCSCY